MKKISKILKFYFGTRRVVGFAKLACFRGFLRGGQFGPPLCSELVKKPVYNRVKGRGGS